MRYRAGSVRPAEMAAMDGRSPQEGRTTITRRYTGFANYNGAWRVSVDFRDRVVAAITGSLSRRQAAVQFSVSGESAIRWHSSQALGKVQVHLQVRHRRSRKRANVFRRFAVRLLLEV